MQFRKVSVELVKLKKAGDSVEGFLRQINDVQMAKGPATEIVLEGTDGTPRSSILGTSASKAVRLLAIGEYVRITLKGTEKTLSGNNVNLYDVEVGTV